MEKSYDLIVIGTGVAASTVAGRCRAAGWSVAVVDERPYGGTCALRGCDPKKVLRRGAEIADAVRRFKGKGVMADDLHVDWSRLMAFKRTFTDPVPHVREHAFAEKGIATLHGHARFTGTATVAVNGNTFAARHIVIASGAKPRPLEFPGAEHVTLSDDFLALEELPRSVLFIGGGYISFEFAHIAVRAGAEVAMLDRGAHPLKGFDPDLVDRLLERGKALGIAFHSTAAVESIETNSNRLRARARIDGVERTFDADLVVHGAGRIAAVDALDLPRAQVEASKKGVVVNEFLQSPTNPAVYAAGDAAAGGGPPLTPVATLEAEVVAANLLRGNHRKPDYSGVPSIVFTIPALARAGMLESEARERGIRVKSRFSDMGDWYTIRRTGETHAAAKVLVEENSDRIVGAHVLSPEADELINLFALAIQNGVAASRLRHFVSAYPSAGSDLSYLVA